MTVRITVKESAASGRIEQITQAAADQVTAWRKNGDRRGASVLATCLSTYLFEQSDGKAILLSFLYGLMPAIGHVADRKSLRSKDYARHNEQPRSTFPIFLTQLNN